MGFLCTQACTQRRTQILDGLGTGHSTAPILTFLHICQQNERNQKKLPHNVKIFCYTNNVATSAIGLNTRNNLETQMKHATTPASADNTNTSANLDPSSLVVDLLEMDPPSLESSFDDDFTCEEIPSTGPVYIDQGKVTVAPVPAYAIREEVALASLGLTPICAALAGIRFEDKTPVPTVRSSGGLYHPPALALNLESSDRLVVTASALEAVCGDAHALACVSLSGPFDGLPSGLLPLLGDRTLVLLRNSGKGSGNQALYQLEKAVLESSPNTVMLMTACPSPKVLKIKKDEDDEDVVVTLGMWLRARGIGAINSLFSSKIREEKSPLRAAGGYDALGFRGKECVIFSRSRDVIVPLSRMELKDPIALAMAVGASYIKNNHVTVSDKGAKFIDAQSLGMEIIEACEPLDAFDGKNVFGAGVWRNAAGKLVVNTRKAFLLDGTLAKRVDGRDIYIAARDLGITPETVPATSAEARKAFDVFNDYNYETRGGALLSFGSTMDTYLCGANDVRPITFEYGLPGCGKSTICNFKKSLLGDACDHLVGTSEAHLRGMNQLNALGLFLDESEEDDAGESKRVFNFAHKSYSGGNEGKGSAPGQDGPITYTIRSAVHFTANKLPSLTPANISRMVCIKYLPKSRGDYTPSDLIPNPRALRFPEAEALGKRLFMRMLQSDKRNRHNKKMIEDCIETKSTRAPMTLAPAIASAYTALHDDELTPKTAAAWLRQFDIAEAISDIEAAQSGKQIIDHLAYRPSLRAVNGESYLISKLWEMASNGDKKSDAALAVMGMSVHRGEKLDDIEVHLFPSRQGLKDLFVGTEWSKGNLGKMLCDDPRTSSTQSEKKERLAARDAIGGDAERTTGERYITLEWQIPKTETLDDRIYRARARAAELEAEAESIIATIHALEDQKVRVAASIAKAEAAPNAPPKAVIEGWFPKV